MTAPNDHEWLDRAHNAIDLLRNGANQLYLLADAFARTGNARVAEELSGLAADLDAAGQEVSDIREIISSTMLRDAQQATGTMLEALMAGLTLGERAAAAQAPEVKP